MMPADASRGGRRRIHAGTVVACQDGEHRLLKDAVLIVEGGKLAFVGPRTAAPERGDEEVVDATRMLVTPGFVDLHAHVGESPYDKSFVEDVGKRQFSYSGLAEMLPARSGALDAEARRLAVEYSMVELLRTGTTTVMEIGSVGTDVVDAARRIGMRAYVGQSYRSAKWLTRNGNSVEYAWDEKAGEQGLDRAVEFVRDVESLRDGRIKGFLAPGQVDTCTAELLGRTRALGDELGVPVTLHASQSVFEFDAMVQRHGLSPIEWLDTIGFLGENTLLGHAILISGGSWVQFAGNDLELLARSGTSVAHSPWVFCRRGIAMESLPVYLAAGINVCLGTDTAPQSMIESMRLGAVLGKVTGRHAERPSAADLFDAATLNGSRFLRRPDLGRISAGASADLLFWSASSLFMVPMRDPLKNLVYSATPEDLRHVMIDGDFVMRERRVLGIDEQAVCEALQEAAERMWAGIGRSDWRGRGVDELSPPSLPEYR